MLYFESWLLRIIFCLSIGYCLPVCCANGDVLQIESTFFITKDAKLVIIDNIEFDLNADGMIGNGSFVDLFRSFSPKEIRLDGVVRNFGSKLLADKKNQFNEEKLVPGKHVIAVVYEQELAGSSCIATVVALNKLNSYVYSVNFSDLIIFNSALVPVSIKIILPEDSRVIKYNTSFDLDDVAVRYLADHSLLFTLKKKDYENNKLADLHKVPKFFIQMEFDKKEPFSMPIKGSQLHNVISSGSAILDGESIDKNIFVTDRSLDKSVINPLAIKVYIVCLSILMVSLYYIVLKFKFDAKLKATVQLGEISWPPNKFTPIGILYLRFKRPSKEMFVIALISMASKGFLKVIEVKGVFNNQYILEKIGDEKTCELSCSEIILAKHLFINERIFLEKQCFETLSSTYNEFYASVEGEYKGIFFANIKWFFLPAQLTSLLVFMLFVIYSYQEIVLLVGFFIVLLSVNLVGYYALKEKAFVGLNISQKLGSFKKYLADSMQSKEACSKELFEQYVPYALALDVEQNWSLGFINNNRDKLNDYTPFWYAGTFFKNMDFKRVTEFVQNITKIIERVVIKEDAVR